MRTPRLADLLETRLRALGYRGPVLTFDGDVSREAERFLDNRRPRPTFGGLAGHGSRIHESGHAIMAAILGIGGPLEIAVDPSGGGYTRGFGIYAPAEQGMTSWDRRAFLEASAVYALAGKAALDVWGDKHPNFGATHDEYDAAVHVSAMQDPNVSVATFYARALALILAHWGAVARLADELATHGNHLEGRTLESALTRSLAPESA
jgi:hypothetical protein